MADGRSSLRIDWFDGTVIEEPRSSTMSEFADEDQPEPPQNEKAQVEKKPIGFKRLHDISLMEPPGLTLEVAHRPGFWNLLDEKELKGDFIVLIVKILANVYKSLSPSERSKIATQLKTRFRNSNFLVILKNYVIGLPYVRVVEKKTNFQLWDDVEAFYFHILNLCESIINVGGNSEEFLQYVYDLLEITEASAIGVCKEHMETFNEELFVKIRQVRSKIPRYLHKELNNPETQQSQEPNSFKNLNIFPTRNDLLGNTEIDIKPTIINGAYPNVEHYLDLQFKLLREDCFGPLREGLCKYMKNPSKRRHENIRVHPKVRILRTCVTNNKVGHLVDIAWKERINGSVDSKILAYNKQLMFGSLLLFSSDNFENILCATVLDSSLHLLSEGYIAVSFQNPVSQKIFSESYIMVESEVFFEPYHRVLNVLQNSRLDDLPMKKYIVDVQTDTRPPAYLNSDTIYTITDSTREEIPIPVLDTNQWPTYALDLDDSQIEAYKFALTHEFSVIQGPPGTGKTFLGVKIASTLLKNLSLVGTPMLIICYTNHALDQFLEGLLNVTTNIIRLGSQSKSKILEPYTLHNARMKIKSKYSYLYANKRAELENIFKQMTEVQSEIEKCEKEIISYKCLKKHLKVDNKSYELKSCKEDSVLSWLFSHLEGKEEFLEEAEDWESLDIDITDNIETCFSDQWALKEIDSMQNSIKYLKDVTDHIEEQHLLLDKFEMQINKVRKRLNFFKRSRSLYQNSNKNEGITEEITSLYDLTPEQRWRFYYTAVDSIKNQLMNNMNTLLEQHNSTSRELDEVTTLTDSEVMRSARVVGVTTTTAARRHHLITTLHHSIVIVEEAAEVLEAHVVASLTTHCQHLILIGDHKQLRPTAAHYKLAKHYNLEISLFERMVRNGVHARTLSTQRRMRPSFVELLVPIVYERLDSHPSVHGYPDVKGLAHNLYFYDHDVLEDFECREDSWTHKNTFEAKWCVALASYLRQMEYKPDEVTVLSTYTGQVSLIKELSKKHHLLRDIKITAVDNYQGEECRIVILSLVRSNRDGNIGFLSAVNRICVALSRAKEGFYIFGNMGLLKSASNIWRSINEKFVAQKAIGKQITLRCDKHKENTINVENVEDFDNCLSGTCIRICERK